MNLRNKNDLPSEGLDIETLMEALFYRDEFLSIASHELKTPLTSLKLQAQVFKRNTNKDANLAYSKEKVDRMVDQVEFQTARMMKLVEDMLDISRIRSGRLIMTKNPFNLSETVSDVIARQKNVSQIEAHIEKDLSFYGDEDRIAQVLTNLLSNATKYGNDLPIEIRLGQKRQKIFLTVTDHGQGISDEDQIRIFHRFQRGIPATEVSGLGLGLYITREIVEAHNGKISLKSEIDKGSSFHIEFKPVEQ